MCKLFYNDELRELVPTIFPGSRWKIYETEKNLLHESKKKRTHKKKSKKIEIPFFSFPSFALLKVLHRPIILRDYIFRGIKETNVTVK